MYIFKFVMRPIIGQTAKFLEFIDSPGFIEAKIVRDGGILIAKSAEACKEMDLKMANGPCFLRVWPVEGLA
jgi:hypothetical protein